jgi:hypothetical protein
MDTLPVRRRSFSGYTKFVASVFMATALIALIVRLVGPRTVMNSVGMVVVLILFWPLVVAAFGLIVGLVSSLLAGEDAGASEAVELGVLAGAWYYTRLLSLHNPFFWGAIMGAALSVGTLYVYVEKMVVPQEKLVRRQLRDVAAAVKNHHRETGRFPKAAGKYLHEALGLPANERWAGHELVDPWGNPLLYHRTSDEYSESFSITSTGWNGWRDDDIGTSDDIVEKGTVISKGAVGKKLLKVGKEKIVDYVKKKLKRDAEMGSQ